MTPLRYSITMKSVWFFFFPQASQKICMQVVPGFDLGIRNTGYQPYRNILWQELISLNVSHLNSIMRYWILEQI